MDEIRTRLALVESNMKSIDERLERAEHAYFGNGKMGDRTKVAILWYCYPMLAGGVGTVVGAAIMKFAG